MERGILWMEAVESTSAGGFGERVHVESLSNDDELSKIWLPSISGEESQS